MNIPGNVKISTLFLIFFNIIIWHSLFTSTVNYMADVMGLSSARVVVYAKDSLEPSHGGIAEPLPLVQEKTVEEWVLDEAESRGLNREEVWAIIQMESSWRTDAININTNGTYDLGLWQWNSIHKDISTECKLDYKCSSNEAFNKRIHDGDWSAWYGAKKLGIK